MLERRPAIIGGRIRRVLVPRRKNGCGSDMADDNRPKWKPVSEYLISNASPSTRRPITRAEDVSEWIFDKNLSLLLAN